MDDDKILDKLEDLRKKGRFKKIRKTYRKHRDSTGFSDHFKNFEFGGTYNLGDDARRGRKLLKSKEVDPVEVGAIAHHLMSGGLKYSENPHPLANGFAYAFLGAQLYEKIGKGRKASPRLMKALHYTIDKSKGDTSEYEQQAEDFVRRNLEYEEVERYLKRGEGEQQTEGGLAGRVGVFALFIAGGAALSLGSLSITGNVISNLTRTTPGLLGIILFIAGLTGVFFYFKER